MPEERQIQTLVVEDEYPARMLMIDYILNCPELKLAGIAEDGNKAIDLLKEKQFDLVFIDINLPAITGIDIIKLAKQDGTSFIFTTAYSEYAVEAFNLEAVDYLLKPFSFDRFRKSVEKFLKMIKEKGNASPENPQSGRLHIQSESATHILNLSEIHYVSSHNKSSVIHTENKDYETPKLLKEIEEKLPSETFVRIHKGYLVNKLFIANLRYDKGGAYLLQLKNLDETVLPVGRSYALALKEMLGLR
ncbi:response regulator [Leptospira ryugenii]|uniref:Response regulator n=1 Tax=Leptospira ryugenii TaxID=1917863 RepID=A0A2P2E208_9LEPT|nr:LytTR family DNA-binding domain-containing protein [Leptospira ryugenii]GBF50884.1 response regulator [Leptospira ryugenii]